MLKELWRKLGADVMHADDVARNGDESRDPGSRGGDQKVRVIPHITHTGEFHLERLISLLNARYGKSLAVPKHTGASDHTLKEVIRFAARIQDQDIQRELLLFYLNCSPVIQEFLRCETLLGQDSRLRR
ncbi:MAG: hypothetical protein R6T87_00845 [Marinobacter sp.]